MENLVKHDMISEEAKAWLTAALDPFHDTRIPHLEGWPDGTTAPSVVRCVKQSVTITAPEQEGQFLDDWCLLVTTNPILNKRRVFPTDSGQRSGNKVGTATSDYYDLAFINYDSYSAGGTPLAPWGPGTGNVLLNGSIQLPDAFCKAKGRLVGAAFEVYNVTPELYQAGTCTVGRYPQSNKDPFVAYKYEATAYATTPAVTDTRCLPFTARPVDPVPSTLAEAMYLEGSRQWEAKKGCYVVIPFQDQYNPISQVDYKQPWVTNYQVEDTVDSVNINSILTPTITSPTDGWPANKWAPVDSTFAIFSGLNAQTKLQLNTIMYYETFPGVLDTEIVTLATPSPPYDVHALELYKHCLAKMPVGVPVDWNGLGDWFAMAVSEFSDLAGLGLSALGVPFAGTLAQGAKNIANSYLKSQNTQQPAPGKTMTVTQAYTDKKKKAKAKQKAKAVAIPKK